MTMDVDATTVTIAVSIVSVAMAGASFTGRLLAMAVERRTRNGQDGGSSFSSADREQLIRIAVAVERSSNASMQMVDHLRSEIREAREFRETHARKIMSSLDDFKCRATCDEDKPD